MYLPHGKHKLMRGNIWSSALSLTFSRAMWLLCVFPCRSLWPWRLNSCKIRPEVGQWPQVQINCKHWSHSTQFLLSDFTLNLSWRVTRMAFTRARPHGSYTFRRYPAAPALLPFFVIYFKSRKGKERGLETFYSEPFIYSLETCEIEIFMAETDATIMQFLLQNNKVPPDTPKLRTTTRNIWLAFTTTIY